MAKKTCPIRSNICNRSKCMFWKDVDDPDADGCLIVGFFCNFNALNFENLGSLAKLAGKNSTR